MALQRVLCVLLIAHAENSFAFSNSHHRLRLKSTQGQDGGVVPVSPRTLSQRNVQSIVPSGTAQPSESTGGNDRPRSTSSINTRPVRNSSAAKPIPSAVTRAPVWSQPVGAKTGHGTAGRFPGRGGRVGGRGGRGAGSGRGGRSPAYGRGEPHSAPGGRGYRSSQGAGAQHSQDGWKSLVLSLKDASPHEAMVTLKLITQSLLEPVDDSTLQQSIRNPPGANKHIPTTVGAATGAGAATDATATATRSLGVLRLDDRDFTLLINAAAKAKDWRLALRFLRQLEKTPVAGGGNSAGSSSHNNYNNNNNDGPTTKGKASAPSSPPAYLQPNVFHYTAAIGACRAAGSANKEPLAYAAALDLFAEMKSRGVAPNAYTYTNVLSATCDGALAAKLLNEMATSYNLQPDVFHYSAAVAAADRGGQWEVALELVDEMQKKQVMPNQYTFSAAIRAVSRSGQWQAALDLLAQMSKIGLIPGVEASSAAITACGEAGQPKEALKLLDDMKQQSSTPPNEITYNAAMTACAKSYQVDQALDLLKEMETSGLKPSVVSYNAAMSACMATGQWKRCVSLLRQAQKRGPSVRPDLISYNTAISACMRGVVYEAEESAEAAAEDNDSDLFGEDNADSWDLFGDGDDDDDEEEIDFSNTGSYALTISSQLSSKKLKKSAEIDADASALSNFNDGLADATATVRRLLARDTPKHAKTSTPTSPSAAGSATVAATAQVEDEAPLSPPLEMAMALLAEMKGRARVPPNFVTYSALLAACDKAGAGQLALRMLNEMTARKISPTIYSYAAAISACERSGQWRASLALLDRMQAAGVPPDRTIYSSVACTLARSRQLPALKRLLSELVKLAGTLGAHASNYMARVRADQRVSTPASSDGHASLGLLEMSAKAGTTSIQAGRAAGMVDSEGEARSNMGDVIIIGGDANENDDAATSDRSWLEWLGGTLLDILPCNDGLSLLSEMESLGMPRSPYAFSKGIEACASEVNRAAAVVNLLNEMVLENWTPDVVDFLHLVQAAEIDVEAVDLVDFGVGEYAESPEASTNRQQAEARAVEKVTHAFAAVAAACAANPVASTADTAFAVDGANTNTNGGATAAGSASATVNTRAAVAAASAAVKALHAPGSGRSVHSLMSALSSSSSTTTAMTSSFTTTNDENVAGATNTRRNNGGSHKDACVGGILSLAMANMQAQLFSSSSETSNRGLPVELYNVALEACLKTEQFHDFLATAVLFLEDPARPAPTKETLDAISSGVATYGRRNRWAGALSLVEGLQRQGLPLSRSTYLSLMTALEREGRWAEAVSQIRNMKAAHLPLDVIVYSAAISACERGAAWQEALELLADMEAEGVEPNVVSYNAAISACEKAGQWLEAIGLFEGMKKSGAPEAQPDMVTYSALLSALATSHQVELMELFYAEGEAQGVLNHWSRREPTAMDLHHYSVPMSCTAVRLVLKRMVESRYMPLARGFASTSSSSTTRSSSRSTSSASEATINPTTSAAPAFDAVAASASAKRGWSHGAEQQPDLVIITGQGRGSVHGRPVIQPAIMRLLRDDFSPSLEANIMSGNKGRLVVPAASIQKWLEVQQECLPFDGSSHNIDEEYVVEDNGNDDDEIFRYDGSDIVDGEVFGFDEDFDFDV